MLNVREKKHQLLAAGRVLTQIAFLITIVFLVYFECDSLNLLITGRVCAVIASVLVYAWISNLPIWIARQRLSVRKTLALLRSNKSFPLFVMPANFFNRAGYQLPVILIERYFGATSAGQYSLVLRLGFGPIAMVGSALTQIYHGKLAELRRDNTALPTHVFRRVRNALLPLGLVVFLTFWLWVPSLVLWVFGPGFSQGAEFLRYMSPFFGVMIVVAPLTVGFFVLEAQKSELMNQFLLFIVAAASFGLGIVFGSVHLAVVLFSLLSGCRYLFMYGQLEKLHATKSFQDAGL